MAGVSGKFQQSEEIKLNRNMEYVQFLGEIRERVEAHFNGKVMGEVCTSLKNNGVKVTGLMLKSEQERVAPNFYLENQFVEWMRGLRTLEDISEKLCDSAILSLTHRSMRVADNDIDGDKLNQYYDTEENAGLWRDANVLRI